MTKKVKLAFMKNEKSRAITLKKRRSGLVKKVKEISTLCDVKACLIMFSPKEAEPMVWPSAEAARNLLKDFDALPAFTKKKNETSLESYLKEKTWKVHESLRKKTQKENMECMMDQLKVQLSSFPKLDDLDVKEIYSLISFAKDAIMHLRKKVGSVQHCPLRDPPVYPFEEQVKEFRTTTGGGQEYERARKTYEEVNMASIGASKEKQTYYLMDEWIFPSLKQPSPQTHQQIMMNMASYNNNNTLDPGCYQTYHPYQGSSSNGDHNMEMAPAFPPALAFPDFLGPVSHPHPYDFMSHEERSNIDNDNNANNISFWPETPPPANGATAEEGIVGASSFDISYLMDYPGINNHHF